ncbi:MAG: hypothetical protein ACR2GO_06150 [Candidatus Limnocylindria bacterium]
MSSNLPARRTETLDTQTDDRMPLQAQRPLSVAFLPLALITFITLALIIAAWTFVAAAT